MDDINENLTYPGDVVLSAPPAPIISIMEAPPAPIISTPEPKKKKNRRPRRRKRHRNVHCQVHGRCTCNRTFKRPIATPNKKPYEPCSSCRFKSLKATHNNQSFKIPAPGPKRTVNVPKATQNNQHCEVPAPGPNRTFNSPKATQNVQHCEVSAPGPNRTFNSPIATPNYRPYEVPAPGPNRMLNSPIATQNIQPCEVSAPGPNRSFNNPITTSNNRPYEVLPPGFNRTFNSSIATPNNRQFEVPPPGFNRTFNSPMATPNYRPYEIPALGPNRMLNSLKATQNIQHCEVPPPGPNRSFNSSIATPNNRPYEVPPTGFNRTFISRTATPNSRPYGVPPPGFNRTFNRPIATQNYRPYGVPAPDLNRTFKTKKDKPLYEIPTPVPKRTFIKRPRAAPNNPWVHITRCEDKLVNNLPDLDKEIATMSTDEVKKIWVAILPVGFPDVTLSRDEANEIKSMLMRGLDKVKPGENAPRFSGVNYIEKRGFVQACCANKFTKYWAQHALSVGLLSGLKIYVLNFTCVPRTIRAEVWIPGEVDEAEKILNRLQVQNSCLNTEQWSILSRKIFEGGQKIYISLGEAAWKPLKTLDFQPYLNFSRVYFKILGTRKNPDGDNNKKKYRNKGQATKTNVNQQEEASTDDDGDDADWDSTYQTDSVAQEQDQHTIQPNLTQQGQCLSKQALEPGGSVKQESDQQTVKKETTPTQDRQPSSTST